MRFENSLKDLQKAIKDLEKASTKVAKSKKTTANTNQIDMFALASPANDIDVKALKNQLDEAILSMKTLIKESA